MLLWQLLLMPWFLEILLFLFLAALIDYITIVAAAADADAVVS
jgi:hypothetical protein